MVKQADRIIRGLAGQDVPMSIPPSTKLFQRSRRDPASHPGASPISVPEPRGG